MSGTADTMANKTAGNDLADIKSMDMEQLRKLIVSMGEQPYRARQIYEWIHVRLAASFDEMTNLPASLRAALAEKTTLKTAHPLEVLVSKKDGTRKYLFRLEDGNVIESVLMQYRYGSSVCISSQVGCRMGCRFCASAIGGRIRNLQASEMLEQVYRIGKLSGQRISHVVVMGTGEPLDNYDNLVKFIRILSGGDGLRISQRAITVSTCGIVPAIRALAEEKLQITLALSLHAPSQEKRRMLMPVADRYPLDEVLRACGEYFHITGRRVTFEYSLVKGSNDSASDARMLAALLGPMKGHVNLIPVNPVTERGFARPNRTRVLEFKNILEKHGIHVTIRRELGTDICGACGQLRRGYMQSEPGADKEKQ